MYPYRQTELFEFESARIVEMKIELEWMEKEMELAQWQLHEELRWMGVLKEQPTPEPSFLTRLLSIFVNKWNDNNKPEDFTVVNEETKRCPCFCEESGIIGWEYDEPIAGKITVCNGTKERKECTCDGDPAKCEFYPHEMEVK